MKKRVNIIIIGAGPAGMTAAVYATRANLSVALVESGAPGGKLIKTSDIENYPGFVTVNGADLAAQMFEHAIHFGADYQYGDVVRIEDKGDHKVVHMADGSSLEGDTVIIATGTKEVLLEIPGEAEYTARGVSYCAVCDGGFFKNKVVTVVGGGNSALEEALYLTQFAKKVNLLVRRNVFRADAYVQDKVMKHPQIEVFFETKPVEIKGDGSNVKSILVQSTVSDELQELETDGVFPFIGATPVSSFANDLPILDPNGYVIVNEHMETAVPGIYAAGDVCVKGLRQIVTATSDGAVAAQRIYHYLH